VERHHNKQPSKLVKVTPFGLLPDSCVTTADADPPACAALTTALIESNTYCGYILDTSGPFADCAVLALAATFMEDCVMDVCVVSGNGEEAMKATACASLGAFAAVCQLKAAAPSADWELMTDCGEFRRVVFTADTRHSHIFYNVVIS